MYETVRDDEGTMVVIPAYKTKTCPQCGQGLFDDMDVCFGCLYQFPHEDGEREVEEPEGEGESWCEQEMVPTEAYGEAAVEPELSSSNAPMGVRVSTADVEVVVPLPSGGLLVGRGGSCDIVLRARSVSRRHVRIEPDGEGALVIDQVATNPARVNGTPVKGSTHISAEDVLEVCGTTLRLA